MFFLANENFPLTSIKILREDGYNVESILEKNPGAKDLEVLKKSKERKTYNLNF